MSQPPDAKPAPRRGFFARLRARSRGITPPAMILEGAMVMGWYVCLVVGEKGMSQAVSCRRAVEDGTDESATKTSAADCQSQPASASSGASISPSTFTTPKPDVQAAISAVAGLGIGSERTFPYYLLPMQNVRATGEKEDSIRLDPRKGDEQHAFKAGRSMGCVEKPLDTPMGTMDEYRIKIWLTNFMGYK